MTAVNEEIAIENMDFVAKLRKFINCPVCRSAWWMLHRKPSQRCHCVH